MTSLLALVLRRQRIVAIDVDSGAVDVVTDDAGPAPDGVVAVDETLYWTTMGEPVIDPDVPGELGRDYSGRNGGVRRCRLDGSGLADVLPAGTITTGKQLTTDGAGYLYWGDREGCRVSRARLDGSGLEDLVVNAPTDDGTAECVGVAVDTANGYLYWSQKGPMNGGRGRILRAGLTLPDGATPAARDDIEVVWDRLPEPIDLEIVGDRLFWTDRGLPTDGGNSLNRAALPPAGEAGAPPVVLAGRFDRAIGLAVDEAAGLAYVSALGGDVWQIPLGDRGGRSERLLAAFGEPITGLALLR